MFKSEDLQGKCTVSTLRQGFHKKLVYCSAFCAHCAFLLKALVLKPISKINSISKVENEMSHVYQYIYQLYINH